MSAHEHFIKKTSTKTVVSIRHALISYSAKKRVEAVRRRSMITAGGDRQSVSVPIEISEPTITGLRYEYCVMNGKRSKVHKVFVHCFDSGSYARVGWVLNDDVEACMVCHKVFYEALTSGKHHCRACGNIVCTSCSPDTAVVTEIQSLGPVRVCTQCYFGQEVVSAAPNDFCGETYHDVSASEGGLESIICEDPDEVEIPLSLWSFGPMTLAETRPCFVIRTRRTNRDRVYINICSCEAIPYNESIDVGGKRVIFLVCGSMGRTPDGFVVYDVAMSPKETVVLVGRENVIKLAKAEICEQALVGVSALTSERDFHSYQWETDITYKERVVETKTSSEALAGLDAGAAHSHWMAVPAARAFADLLQCCTQLKDLVPERDASGQPVPPLPVNKEYATMHRERLERKLLAGSASCSEGEDTEEEVLRQSKTIQLTPYPGFVVKTRKAGDHLKKVFINVYHHEDVDAFVDELVRDHFVGRLDEPHVFIAEPSDVSDKEGVTSLLYHVAVGSKYFLESYAQSHEKITDDRCVQKILDALNVRFVDDLDKSSFVLPRIKGGFKGDWIADELEFAISRPPASRLPPTIVTGAGLGGTGLFSSADEDTFGVPMMREDADSGRHSVVLRDNDSIVSDLTTASDASNFSMTRKSIFSMFYPQKQRPAYGKLAPLRPESRAGAGASASAGVPPGGKELINADMLMLNRQLNLDLRGALQLKQLSVTDPLVLTGWQVTLFDKNNKSDVYVITGARKNHLRKVEYRLTNLEKGDMWIRLKRSEKKTGAPFTINRRVLVLSPPA